MNWCTVSPSFNKTSHCFEKISLYFHPLCLETAGLGEKQGFYSENELLDLKQLGIRCLELGVLVCFLVSTCCDNGLEMKMVLSR